MFKLASLFVDIKADDSALKSQISGVQKQLGAFGVAIGTAVGSLAATAISSAASALTGFITKGITGAANMGESLSKVDAVFGESASKIKGTADELAKAYGLPKQAILDAGAAIGLIGKGVGQSQAAAAELGSNMAKLAADAASFYNVPLDEALNKIRSGLIGEAEPLRAFGVLLTEEAVAAEAVALGLAKSTKEIDNQAKVAARTSLITKGLADASGDLERTQNSTANQFRKFQGSIENLAVSLGTSMGPAINEVINLLNSMSQAVIGGVESGKGAFEGFVSSITAGVRTIGVIFRNFDDFWKIAVLTGTEGAANVVAVFDSIAANIVQYAQYIGRNWFQILSDANQAVGLTFINLGKNIASLAGSIWEFLQNPTGGFNFEWTPLLDGFQAASEKLPEIIKPAWVSMQDEIGKIGDEIAQRESKRAANAAGNAAAAAKAGAATAAAASKKEHEFKSETVGSAEFASKLQASIFDKDETAKEQLGVQKQTLAELRAQGYELKQKRPAFMG